MMAVLTGILVLLSMSVVFLSSSINFAGLGNYINLDRNSRNALDHMTINIRQSKQLTSFSSGLLVFQL